MKMTMPVSFDFMQLGRYYHFFLENLETGISQ